MNIILSKDLGFGAYSCQLPENHAEEKIKQVEEEILSLKTQKQSKSIKDYFGKKCRCLYRGACKSKNVVHFQYLFYYNNIYLYMS